MINSSRVEQLDETTRVIMKSRYDGRCWCLGLQHERTSRLLGEGLK